MAFGVLFAQVTGFGLRGEALTSGWWITRPLWVAVLAVLTAPLVLLFHRIEVQSKAPVLQVDRPVAVVAGSVAAAVGLGLLAFGGFYRQDGFLALAVLPLSLLAIGAALLGQIRLPGVGRPGLG